MIPRETMARRGDLTPKQVRFVLSYLSGGFNGSAAYREVYSPKASVALAAREAKRLLANHKIAPLVKTAEQKAKRAFERTIQRYEISQERISEELAKIAFANMGNYMKVTKDGDPYFDYAGLTDDQKAALQEVTVDDYVEGRGDDARVVKKIRFKLYDKQTALMNLAKLHDLIVDRQEHTHNFGRELARMSRDQRRTRLVGLLEKANRIVAVKTIDEDGEEVEDGRE